MYTRLMSGFWKLFKKKKYGLGESRRPLEVSAIALQVKHLDIDPNTAQPKARSGNSKNTDTVPFEAFLNSVSKERESHPTSN